MFMDTPKEKEEIRVKPLDIAKLRSLAAEIHEYNLQEEHLSKDGYDDERSDSKRKDRA
jgi:hypothetical protein